MSLGLLIRILPVSSKRLLNCSVQFKDAKLKGCQVLPLFNRQGVVRQVLIFSPRGREWWLIPWSPRLLWVPLLQPVRIGLSQVHEPEGSSTVGESLWYYLPPVGGIPSDVDIILAGKASNCAGILPPGVVHLFFRRSLSKLVLAGITDKSGYQLGRWKPAWLADSITSAQAPAWPPRPQLRATSTTRQRTGGWVLDPIWQR